ncbi:CGNR zinc finger domain-containing protein [Microbispora sp. H11081]|uniref:CGNR zinc finger domain-containing protein n=1 Tax=Microbispora sp. H11081 TaxID=2729107 RepID=UPI00289A14B4|nr:CGNR zinc finger domain-containing protein [Microbispora sp. H11081]
MTIEPWRITGQPEIDSYVGRWAELAVLLVNVLAVDASHGRRVTPPQTGEERLAAILAGLAAAGRPAPGPAQTGPAQTGHTDTGLTAAGADRLAEIAAELRPLYGAGDRLPEAAERLNDLLARHGAVPTVYADDGKLKLAFHRSGATLVDAWAADMGTALAMVAGVGQGARLGACEAATCSLVFFDTTRNASRRFCDLSCQNRAKASAYRARRRT